MDWALLAALLFCLSSSSPVGCTGNGSSITAGKSVVVGETLISLGQNFAAGFFKPGNSTNRYVGIWYNNYPGQTPIWVANRENPLLDSSGTLTISDDGNLVAMNGNMTVLWSSGVSPDVLRGKNTSAVLVDTGNLVLRDEGGTVWWQSFDYPSDTCIPGMKFRFNLTTGRPRGLISWKNADDPSPGEFSVKLDPQWPYQLLMTNGSSRYWRSTWWNGRLLTFVMGTGRTFASYFTIAADRDEFVLTFSLSDPSVTSRFVMSNSGSINQLTWVEETKSWSKSFSIPSAICHFYAHCGPFGVCNRKKSPECTCLEGFEPRRRDDWRKGNWSSGCARLKALSCNERDAFFKLERMKQPDLPTPLDNLTRTQCESECLRNCSCTAFSYATLGIESSPRCIVWLGNLMDLEENQRVGQEVYIRLVPSEQGGLNGAKHNGRRLVAITVPTLITGVLLGINFGYFFWRLKMRGRRQQENHRLLASVPDVPLFRFSALVTATRNFSTANKLGEGGFGPVYKGKLSKGQEIAVKRLSQCSGQGSVEFRNEVELIGKLQHRNLVRLLGWCIHKEEKILIYEFMPNKSLDKLIFDPTQQGKLDWGKRFRIAQGIAQGLLYLHQHSRLRVIHRDLKPNNILLDAEMNPKISDFGLARIFEGNQTQADTSRVVGTYGYMSPEYALDGRFSEKSDVFSFGVILLELVSGKRSTGFYPLKNSLNLLGYAWLLWRDDRGLELLDPSTQDSFVGEEVARCVHVGLLCVQEDPEDRPDMSSVVFMLINENVNLPSPKQPPFAVGKGASSSESSEPPSNYFSFSEEKLAGRCHQ